jgi:hypothetical protein
MENLKKIIKEELLNEVGGQDIMNDFGNELDSLIDRVLNHYEGKLSKTMVAGLLINAIQTISDKKKYTGSSPETYR